MSKSKEQDFSPQSWYICCSSKWNKSIVTSIASSSLSAQTSHFWVEFLDLGHFTNKKPGYQDVKQLACWTSDWALASWESWRLNILASTFLPTVTPGESLSTMKPVNPLPGGASGSVRANRKYLHYKDTIDWNVTLHSHLVRKHLHKIVEKVCSH